MIREIKAMSYDRLFLRGIERVKDDKKVIEKLIEPVVERLYNRARETASEPKPVPPRVDQAIRSMYPELHAKMVRLTMLRDLLVKSDREASLYPPFIIDPELKAKQKEKEQLHDKIHNIEKEMVKLRVKKRLESFLKVAEERGVEVTEEDLKMIGLKRIF